LRKKGCLTFNVELDHVGEGMKLHVSVREALTLKTILGRPRWLEEDSHKGILQAHHTDDEDVHTKRETNDPHVKSDESLVFNHYYKSADYL
jgi:hypothetical protein